MIHAAGILIVNKLGEVLLLRRGDGGDYPGHWCFPGGRLEEGETARHGAVRETEEETGGFRPKEGDLLEWTRRISPRATTGAEPTPRNPSDAGAIGAPVPAPVPIAQSPDGTSVLSGEQVDFTTFLLRSVEPFTPDVHKSGEHVGWMWTKPSVLPTPMHPGCTAALMKLDPNCDELCIAKLIRDGELVSPQKYENVWLFDMRITGTGAAYRHKHEEFVWRDKSLYLNEHFRERCNGLPVILEHPEKNVLNSKEYKERNVGSIFVPYFKDDEVWGIAKIHDESVAQMMIDEQLSTSPAVVWRDPDVNSKVELEDGSKLLIEGKPSLLDHLAICEKGVWDKGGDPVGVETTARKDDDMKLKRLDGESDAAYKARCDEAEKAYGGARVAADADGGEHLDKMLKGIDAKLDSMGKRMDAMEEEHAADRRRKDDDDDEEHERKDKRKDSKRGDDKGPAAKGDDDDDDAKKDDDDDDEEHERKDKRKDSKRSDARRRRKDDEDEEEKPLPVAADKKRRKDDDDDDDCADDAEEEHEKADSKADTRGDAVDALRAEIADLRKRMPMSPNSEEYAATAKYQAVADSVYSMFGKSAPRRLDGETLTDYRVRLVQGVQEHSTLFAKSDLRVIAVDDASFEPIERQIFADAQIAARTPTNVPVGRLLPVERQLRTGHMSTEFHGQPKSWMNRHAPAKQYIKELVRH